MMMGLADLKKKRGLVDAIDWDMSPEEAVRLYLEWGNNWSQGYRMIRSKEDATYYFVLNTWEASPVVYFIRRVSEGAAELAKVELPPEMKDHIQKTHGDKKGLYAVEAELRDWLKQELGASE